MSTRCRTGSNEGLDPPGVAGLAQEVPPSLSLHTYVSLFPYIYISLALFLSLYIYTYICLYLSIHMCLSINIHMLYVTLSLSLCLSRALSALAPEKKTFSLD